ncbi:hypothetical protein DFH06DRAFT_1159768 [Mycena polygramma]|nr:hypothetical protein DFH06DRAFT_1159768 [Mycena polygramma]
MCWSIFTRGTFLCSVRPNLLISHTMALHPRLATSTVVLSNGRDYTVRQALLVLTLRDISALIKFLLKNKERQASHIP